MGYLILIFFISVLYYLPVLLGKIDLLDRGNDLTNFFWPVIYFVKIQILQFHNFPLWNNLILAGTPLLPDPQSPLFYFPNIIFLFLPINTAFLTLIFLHLFLGAYFCFLAAKKGFNFSNKTSLFIATLYLISPKLAGFLEAGHLGLVFSYTWIPLILLSTIVIAKKQQLLWALILTVSLAAVFMTHTVIFLISILSATLLLIYNLSEVKKFANKRRVILLFATSLILFLGLAAVELLPQLEWSGQTTRFLLLQDKDVYPKWRSLKEFSQVALNPMFFLNIDQIDTEKWIPLGIFPFILALVGFYTLKKKLKITLTIFSIIILLLSLNNISPFYRLLTNLPIYDLLRVSTRFWSILLLIVYFLAGFAVETLSKKHFNKKLIVFLVILSLAELTFLSGGRLFKPVPKNNLNNQKIISFLKQDKDRFRIFCLNRCISQKEAAENNLELLDGYNTLIQKNFYQQAWQLTGSYWNYYTLSIPPIGTYTLEKLKPDPKSLGEYNVKYIISTYSLDNSNFLLKEKINNYYIYQNSLFLSRAYYLGDNQQSPAVISHFLPNAVDVQINNPTSTRLVLASVYNPGWKAYLNGTSQVSVQQKSNALMQVDLKPDTKYVRFIYLPESYQIGLIISMLSLVILIPLVSREVHNLKSSRN